MTLRKPNSTQIIVAAALIFTGSACRDRNSSSQVREGEGQAPVAAVAGDVSPVGNLSPNGGVRGSADVLPAELANLPRFKMSTSFPSAPAFQTPPPPTPNMQVLKGVDAVAAKAEAKRWLDAMQAYIYDDMNNQSNDPNGNFRLGNGGEISKKRWYHMPWMQNTGVNAANQGFGREALWGLTRETIDLNGPFNWPVRIGGNCLGQEWGIALFNEPGGYAFGQVFPNGNNVVAQKAVFPQGTVSAKLLFAVADTALIPEIATAMPIQAWIDGGGVCFPNTPRRLTKMYHIQMDVMMKFGPNNADWIFGVFVHNPKNIVGPQNPQGFWQGMEPLGVQWGTQLQETIVVSPTLKPNGNGGRLNGPSDGQSSNCYGCHQSGRDFSFEFGIAFGHQATEKARFPQLPQ